ncbi:hypothetical protein A2U01_0000555, partial [Trifolium medium]|nr:hypothetical protein [Trifolium medium]
KYILIKTGPYTDHEQTSQRKAVTESGEYAEIQKERKQNSPEEIAEHPKPPEPTGEHAARRRREKMVMRSSCLDRTTGSCGYIVEEQFG